MRRRATGGAGGRPAAIGPVRPGRALLRAALVPVVATMVGVLAPAAHAAPAAPLAAPAVDQDDDARNPDRPLRIDVKVFEPRTVTPGSKVTVKGFLTNTGDAPITDLTVRLQRGNVLRTRADLVAAEGQPDAATTVVPAFQPMERSVEPGGKPVEFKYEVDSAELHLDEDGVYPVLLNVNGTVDGDTRRVGELSTFVVQQPLQPTARTAVAWLWPLTERSHRDASGRFADDGLAESIAKGGRLDRALDVVERLPRSTTAPGSTTPVPDLPVTLAIDPALVEEIQLMEAGGGDLPGDKDAAADAAENYLRRLKDLAALHPVVALPYGDVDVDALYAAGLDSVVTRSLPAKATGTAQDPPGSSAEPPPDATVPTANGSDAPADNAPAPEDGAGARILADALDVEPRTDLAWAPGGTLRADSLARLRDGGIDRLVLSPSGLSSGDDAVGLRDDTVAAASTVGTPRGPLDVLVADSRLSDVVAGAEHTEGGPRLAEQRYLAELAVLTARAPFAPEQTVLVTAPREVDAGPDGAAAMMADTASLQWLRPASLTELAAGPHTDGGELVEPLDTVRLDAEGLAGVTDVVAGRDDLAGAVAGDPGTALQAFDASIARATSAAWRLDPEGFRKGVADLASTLERQRDRVTLLAPADGTYTLASNDAPLVLTVRNDLPFAVRVRLDVSARGNHGMTVGDIGEQVLAPGQRATLQVPTSLRQSGTVAVTATLTTPGGNALGERVQMQVRSGSYGPISLIITIGAASLLALLFLRRLVHFVQRRRARAAGTLPAAGPDTTAGTPTRSPV